MEINVLIMVAENVHGITMNLDCLDFQKIKYYAIFGFKTQVILL